MEHTVQPLIIEKLNKTLGKAHIIKDMSFALERGRIYGFLGPNGSGKTTTIRMIVSLIQPDSGDVLIEGKSVRTDREQALRHIGAIVEDPDLYPYLTGKQNLIHFAGMSAQSISASRIEEVVKLVELEHAINKKVKAYSLGMKQRLGIAVSLLHSPSVLILDEPTNGLDPKGIRELRDYLKRLAKEDGVTLLVSSHQLSEVETLCDRAVIIKAGQVVDEVSMETSATNVSDVTVLIEAKPQAKAIQILSNYGPVKETKAGIEVGKQSHDTIPALIKALVDQDVAVFSSTYKRKLEDAYFLLTEEEGGEAS
ncbi:ABC transporter ATP-binding protein [Shouchella shacheensis]|uniref:ABC transporter ATP-binding protein n=1 Tax=Shouchella shacheensis TaxID=1649580 RepID=UPI00073FEDE8|nr:ABC transporter ATP-binding protein [Shouchella shacheensis]